MSFERTNAPGRSPRPSDSMTAAPSPGKRTLVEMLPTAGGHASAPSGAPSSDAGIRTSLGAGALGAADTDTAHGGKHATLGPEAADADEAAVDHDAESSEPGVLVSEITASGWSGSSGDASGEGASDTTASSTDHAPALEHGTSGQPGTAEGRPAEAPVQIRSATVKHAPGGQPNTRTTVAVGEVVHLTGSAAGTWKASAGRLHGSHGQKVTWTAPATPADVAIRLTAGGQSADRPFTVIAPNHLSMKRASVDSFPAGTQGAGMITNVTVGPSSVSFGNVEWLEVPEGPSDVTGYFKKFKSQLNHHPNPSWLPWNDANTGLTDHASLFGWPKPWSAGGFQWNIPNKYRVTSVGGAGHVFTTTHQVFRMTKNGTTTITKGGARVSRTP